EPGVRFVLVVLPIKRRFAAAVFQADVADPPRAGVRGDGAATEFLIDGGGNRAVDGDLVSLHRRDRAVPMKLPRPRPPAEAVALTAHVLHADLRDPLGRARAGDDEGVAGFEFRPVPKP